MLSSRTFLFLLFDSAEHVFLEPRDWQNGAVALAELLTTRGWGWDLGLLAAGLWEVMIVDRSTLLGVSIHGPSCAQRDLEAAGSRMSRDFKEDYRKWLKCRDSVLQAETIIGLLHMCKGYTH